MLAAEPTDGERFGVVVVVSFDFRSAADFTGLLEQAPVTNCVVDCPASAMLIRMSLPTFHDAGRAFGAVSLSVILAIVLCLLLSILLNVCSSTGATLVEMSISHHRMTIELVQWKHAPALEAAFHR
jgi:hypothetical protein